MNRKEKESRISTVEDVFDDWVVEVMNGKRDREETNEEMQNILSDLLVEGVITKKDIERLERRADVKNRRTLIDFWIDIKVTYRKEVKTRRQFINILRDKGEDVSFEEYGNEDEGKVRIINRRSKPDIFLLRDGAKVKYDIKNMENQYLKLSDLQSYSRFKAGAIIKSKGVFWLYPPSTVQEIFKMVSADPKSFVRDHKKHGKPIVRIGSRHDGNICLNDLMSAGKVEKIEIPKGRHENEWL